jgi:hypothetical protein
VTGAKVVVVVVVVDVVDAVVEVVDAVEPLLVVDAVTPPGFPALPWFGDAGRRWK